MSNRQNEQQSEQRHLDKVVSKIKQKKYELKLAIKNASSQAQDLNTHFYDDVKLDYDGYSTSMETALSIRQQQQLLDEREHAWQHSARQLSTVERLEKKPYFARVDFSERSANSETIYIGLGSFADENNNFLIYDWRAPISSIYYDGKLGKVTYNSPDGEITLDMTKKRQFMIENAKIINMFDTNESIGDQMLLEVLSEKSSTQMKSIVTTIQQEQNKIIRNTSADLLFVQGAAGSGKTSAIMQRIAYLLYRYRGNLTSSDVIMFSPNQLFNDYIREVLPEMGEQNMVQMTYWQFVARRLPKMHVENLFDQFEDKKANLEIDGFKDTAKFFNLVTRYANHLNQSGMIFKNIYFRDTKRPFFAKEKIKEIYYSFNDNYSLANRIDATREELIKQLNHKINTEIKKPWVLDAIQGLSKEQLNELYDRPDQEFSSEEKEERFLGRKIVINSLKPVYQRIRHNGFINMRAQYLNFLRMVPQMIELNKYDILLSQWQEQIESVRKNFKEKYIHMNDVSAYLYLYDLITGRRVNYEIRYAFIDEIQDYTAFQLYYLKYNFPRAKFTMLGDLNQAIFTKDESQSLLKQISGLFSKDKTEVVQLTKSYRSTKQLTDFTKQILRRGEKIEAFNREGPKPILWAAQNQDSELDILKKIIGENNKFNRTTAVITKDLADAKAVSKKLKNDVKFTLIATANQRLVSGTLILPSYLAKGLEFDAVVMWDATSKKYHKKDETQLVYTITSRAMYKLDILYQGEKSPLLAVDESTYEEK